MAFQIGDVVGDYRVTGVLGRGGMGRVYRVRSLLTDREEAMKVVLDDDPAMADRFLREIKLHASLQHPNIAALHAAMRIGDRVLMVMELVEGVTLEELLRHGALEIPAALHYLGQVLDALGFAHQRGVIHRDIKPANILVAADGVVKLADFGIARAEGVERLTGTGMAVGTLAYMSPEQVQGAAADARSDIYSIGLTAYEMVTGRRAISADTGHALMSAQLNFMPPPPASLNPGVPADFSEAILRAIAKEPAQRFQSALAFREAVEGPARDSMQSAPRPVLISTLTPPARPSAESAPGSAPANSPELAEIEARLSRAIGPIARRLVADAARRYTTMPEIRAALAAQIEDPKERAAFSRVVSAPTATMPSSRPAAPAAPASFSPEVLDRLAQELAGYIGPIAKVMVARAARSAPGREALLAALAAEISAPAERERFLAAARPVW